MKVYRESDLSSNLLEKSTVAILGYGNQGRAHALNIRDGGVKVVIGARPHGKGWRDAVEDGFEPLAIDEAVRMADFVSVLLPDEVQGEVFKHHIEGNLKQDAVVCFAHGFAITFDQVKPPPNHDVVLVAPKGQGRSLRKLFTEGKGLPCLVAVGRDASGRAMDKALSYAFLNGCLRSGAIETTFKEETVTDLFGEQVVLCGGVPELVKAAFEMLVSRGYQPEIAYIECLHELKIIADLMQEGGLHFMRRLISKTAAWGSLASANRIFTGRVREKMEEILSSIESGEFAGEWMSESRSGQKKLLELTGKEASHPIEKAGAAVRALMPYLGGEKDGS